jgi:hypothetical protein
MVPVGILLSHAYGGLASSNIAVGRHVAVEHRQHAQGLEDILDAVRLVFYQGIRRSCLHVTRFTLYLCRRPGYKLTHKSTVFLSPAPLNIANGIRYLMVNPGTLPAPFFPLLVY